MLWREGLFLSFSSQYIAKHDIKKDNFKISDQVLKDFEKFCTAIDEKMDYFLPGESQCE